MRRFAAGAFALAFAGMGTIGLAGPSGAQDEGTVDWDYSELNWGDGVELQELDGTISPTVAEPGDEITVAGDCNGLSDPHHPHEVRWALIEEGTFPGWQELTEGDHILQFDAIVQGDEVMPHDEDGFEWQVTFEAPAVGGSFEFVSICVPQDPANYRDCHIGAFGPEGLTLEIDAPPTTAAPTTTVPMTTDTTAPPEETPTAPPAVPVPAEPEFTG